MDGITLSIFFGTALGVVGAWILIEITESKLWKKWMSKLDLCIERTSETKSELDREIAEEEKEIEFLTVQKSKIDHLKRLKRKKDRLYQEVEKDAQRDDMDELGASEYERQSSIPELKIEFNQKYEDEMFELSKSDDPEIRILAISELKRINPFLGSIKEFDNLQQEQMDETLNATRAEFMKALEMAKKEVRDAERGPIENLKEDEWYRCKQCGSTKVTGYRRDYGDGGGAFKYFEHCSDCGLH